MVSVIIPLYNKAPYIHRALNSVLNQIYADFEVIVVDDGSTDGGDKIVRAFKDSRIHLIHQPNAGAAVARNTGIQRAKGDWVAFLDADDIWYENNLSSHVALLNRHPDVVWSAGLYSYKYPDGSNKEIVLPSWFLKDNKDGIVSDLLAMMPYYLFCTNTVMIKRQILLEVGGFDASFKTAEDLDMWIRIGIKYPKICFCSQSMAAYYKETPQSLTAAAASHFNNHHIPILSFVRKYLAMVPILGPVRSRGVRQLCINLLQDVVNMLIHAQVKMETWKVISEFKMVLPKSFIGKSILKLLLPGLIYQFYLEMRNEAIRSSN